MGLLTLFADVVAKLRGVEVAVAKRQNNRCQLAGDLEVDEHGIRSFHVSKTNPVFEKYRTKKLMDKSHPYLLNSVRVVGLRKRGGGRVYIRFLPSKLLPPKARPSPISEGELISSGIPKRAKPGSCVIHTDGAQAYPAVIKRSFPKLKHRAVARSRVEFVKPARPVRLPSGLNASSSGMQASDSTWKQLDKTIPAELRAKASHVMNLLLEQYTWCWPYKVNRRVGDAFAGQNQGNSRTASVKWASPYVPGQHGTPAECFTKYVLWFRAGTQEELRAALPEIEGKELACERAPGQPCHADCLASQAKMQPGRHPPSVLRRGRLLPQLVMASLAVSTKAWYPKASSQYTK